MDRARLALVLIGPLSLAACDEAGPELRPGTVFASVETDASGNDPDDPAIWIHPTAPSASRILGTDKGLGIFVYDLDGRIVQSIPGSAPDNVDLRYHFAYGDASVALASAVDRNDDTLLLLAIDDEGVVSEAARANEIEDFGDLYGSCMYRSEDAFYAFVNAKSGAYRQYELTYEPGDGVRATLVRSFEVESQPEGCVADDEHHVLYLGEEDGGVLRIGADPGDGTVVTAVDRVGEGRLIADVEGLTIYPTADGGGYLIVSSQGSDEYVVYDRRAPNAWITTFRIGEGGGHDAATDTDGIDVSPVPLGSTFPEGVFIAQDDHDDGFSRNFKLVRWDSIVAATGGTLVVDTSVDPRAD